MQLYFLTMDIINLNDIYSVSGTFDGSPVQVEYVIEFA